MVRVNPVYLFDITVACRVLFTEDMSALPTRDSSDPFSSFQIITAERAAELGSSPTPTALVRVV